MESFALSIITPAGESFKGMARSVMAPGEFGFFGILSSHAPMIISLKPGPLTVSADGTDSHYAIGSGILEMNSKNEVLLLTDRAESCASYEEAKRVPSIDE